MAWTPKVWVDRTVQFAGRRLLTPVAGVANTVDVTRAEGTVFAVGDLPDAAALNDLETRIDSAFNHLEDNLGWIDITSQCTWSPLLNTNLVGITQHYAKVNTKTRTVELSFILNGGRANAESLVKIPSAYIPSATSKIVISGNSYDVQANIQISYAIETDGDIIGIHSAGVNTVYYEFCHFMFAY